MLCGQVEPVYPNPTIRKISERKPSHRMEHVDGDKLRQRCIAKCAPEAPETRQMQDVCKARCGRLDLDAQWGYQARIPLPLRWHRAALAQLVEHIIRNDGVRCSSHLSGTSFIKQNEPLLFLAGQSQSSDFIFGVAHLGYPRRAGQIRSPPRATPAGLLSAPGGHGERASEQTKFAAGQPIPQSVRWAKYCRICFGWSIVFGCSTRSTVRKILARQTPTWIAPANNPLDPAACFEGVLAML